MKINPPIRFPQKLFRLALLVWMLLYYLGLGSLPRARAVGEDFRIVFFPDTQYEAESYPEVFNSMTQWIVANRASQNIVFASHLGDIVDVSTSTTQWTAASTAMGFLDAANFYYSVGPGNHDMGGLYNNYFGVSRFAGMPTYAGHYGSNNNDNYSLFSASGLDFILVNLEVDPAPELISWADGLFKQYSNRRGILVSHSILLDNNTLSSTGAEIYMGLKDNPNLFLMMCGHTGVAYLEQPGDDGHTIYMMMADYVAEPNGGNGYLRILRFSPANDRIYATTYSTYDGSSITTFPDQADMIYDMHNTTGAFNKTGPLNGATGVATNPTLTWGTSSTATSYEYCYAATSGCSSFNIVGTNTSVTLSGLNNNSTYYWQVRAITPGGTIPADNGNYWSFTTVPAAPGVFTKTGPANSATGVALNPTLRWGASSGATSYEYCYGTTNPCSNWTSAGTNTSVSLSLNGSTTFYWQVRAKNAGGTTYADGVTTDWSFTTGALPVAFNKTGPANNATGQSVSLTLSWGTSSNASSYDYCYGTANPCSNWTSTGTNTSASLSGLNNNTKYYWQVRAVNAIGPTLADSGTFWSFTTIIAAPGAFKKNSPANAASGVAVSPTLSWGTSPRASSYDYCYDTANPCSNWISAGTDTSAVLSGLNNDQTYYWQVRAVNAGGTTLADSGTFWSFTTIVAAPGAFAKAAPLDGATGISTSPTLSWETSRGATSYEYCFGTANPCSNWTPAGTDTSVTLTGLSNDQVYYWQVRAINLGGTSPADGGTFWSFTTIVAAPGAFRKTSPLNEASGVATNPTLSWATSSGATSYEYCYASSADCSNWTSAGTDTSVALSGLIPGRTYTWQVRAVNAGGITLADNSTSWSFTTQVYLVYLPLVGR